MPKTLPMRVCMWILILRIVVLSVFGMTSVTTLTTARSTLLFWSSPARTVCWTFFMFWMLSFWFCTNYLRVSCMEVTLGA